MPASALDASGEGLFVDALRRPDRPRRTDRGQCRRRPVRGRRRGLAAARRALGHAPGNTGNGAILQSLSDAMATTRDPTGFVSQNAKAGSATMASEIASFFAGRGARSDDDKAYLTARQSALAEQETERDRRRHRHRAAVADSGRAGLRRQRPRALGHRRPDEAPAGELSHARHRRIRPRPASSPAKAGDPDP